MDDSSSFEQVRVSATAGVGWLEFDRPPVNAFDQAMVEEVAAGFAELIGRDDVAVVVLASANERYFSAGADLEVFAGIDEAGMDRWCGLVHHVVDVLRGSPKPLLAAIGGVAVGGGLEMTLHCDVRFATRTARLGQPEVNINFIPPVGATQALVRLIGRPRALRYLYEGELLGAEEALAIGLVDELVEEGELRSVVQAYGERLATKPPEALAAIRATITHGGSVDFSEGLALERERAVELAGTANFAEGVRAFLDKREPRWVR
jgi:enoyl-CoA hydratase/carnithine racemase